MQKISVKINFTGGIVSTGSLLHILEIARNAQVTHVRFGLRQQLLAEVPGKNIQLFADAMVEKNIAFEFQNDSYPNIVSSYAGAGIFFHDTWLSEGVYKDVFDLFNYRPELKINICDSNQTLAPFFTGHLNWISSSHNHFWHLFVRFPKTNTIYPWPELVYTNDIATVSKKIEELIFAKTSLFHSRHDADGEELFALAKNACNYISKKPEKDLSLPSFKLPYYEGFNHYGNTFWLGVYRRDELFAVPFLIDICKICLQTKIAQLYATPWKSIIIRDIEMQHRNLWDFVLGKYRINVRHASNELNWQVEDFDEDGLVLKRFIIRQFDKEDVRTYGLCFGIKTKPGSGVFGSVIICKQKNTSRNQLRSLDRFDILYTEDFNPNSRDYLVFRKDLVKEHLGTYLISICKYFYETQNEPQLALPHNYDERGEAGIPQLTEIVYQCPGCLSIYDEKAGDAEQGISAGTLFSQLPPDYCCSVCETSKAGFSKTEKQNLGLQTI